MTQSFRAKLVESAPRAALAAIAVCALAGYAWLTARPHADPTIRSDGYNYYLYAASWTVYHDATLEALPGDWNGGAYPNFAGMYRWPGTNRWLNRFPIGTSVLMLPFVIAADLLTRWSNFPRDAFSFYYQHAVGLAGIAYFMLGLAAMARTLGRRFSPLVTAAAVVSIALGTNAFDYGVYDGSFGHIYSFAMVAVLIELTDRWRDRPTRALAAGIGVAAALIVLIRHPNGILLLLVPLWRTPSIADLWSRRRDFAIMAAAGVVCLIPQLLIFRWAGGSWFVNAYAPYGIGFTFLAPHVYGTLFSTERGLFFWSPVLLLAIPGWFVSRGWARDVRTACAVVLLLDAWFIASWSSWQYGVGYGHRVFVDCLPLTAPLIASFYAWAAERRLMATVTAVAASLAIALSIAQMVQYWMHIWPAADLTWEQYRQLFLSFQ